MKKSLVVFILITFTFISELYAADAVIECNNCSTDASFKQKALNFIPSHSNSRTYDVYVFNIKTNTIKRFNATIEIEPNFFPLKYAYETQVQSSYRTNFNNLVNSYNYLKSTFDSQKTDYPDGSAFDLRGGSHAALETAISSYIYNDANIATQGLMWFESALLLVGKVVNLQVIERVHFPDGSYVDMEIAGALNGEIFFEYVEGSARDANGNRIPDSQADFANYYGTFVSHDDSVSRWLQYAEQNGIPITYAGSGNKIEVYCYQDTGRTVCVYKRSTL